MKAFIVPLTLAITLGTLAVWNPNQAEQTEAPAKLLRHVVMFKFKDDATAEQVAGIEKAFAELPAKIDAIHSYEWGTNNSPENLNKGLTHCFLVTFKDEKGREAYLPHPAHQEFVKQLKPILDDVCVIDYWTH